MLLLLYSCILHKSKTTTWSRSTRVSRERSLSLSGWAICIKSQHIDQIPSFWLHLIVYFSYCSLTLSTFNLPAWFWSWFNFSRFLFFFYILSFFRFLWLFRLFFLSFFLWWAIIIFIRWIITIILWRWRKISFLIFFLMRALFFTTCSIFSTILFLFLLILMCR